MNYRQAKKIMRKTLSKGIHRRLSTFKEATRKMNKFTPRWMQPIEINGVICQCWADGMFQLHKRVRKEGNQ